MANRLNIEQAYRLHSHRENTLTGWSPPIPLSLKRLHFGQASSNSHPISLILHRSTTQGLGVQGDRTAAVERELKFPLPALGK